jgi:hypothetical protein
VSRSLDLTGWERLGIEKKDTKTDIQKSWGWVGPALLMRMLRTPSASKRIYLYNKYEKGEMQVPFSGVQWQEQSSCGMLLFTADYPD